ncbi:MAG: hypothetical protein ACFB9M_21390 [Myxococcota bacterium]
MGMPLALRGIPDPVLHELTDAPSPGDSGLVGKSQLPGAGGTIDKFGGRVERCLQRGGTLAECIETAGLCLLGETALAELAGALFDSLGLTELTKNYYCDSGCFHCCWVPGDGPGGAGGGCHTSFDSSEGPVINCAPGTYGAGTVGLGEALILGDSIGLGICIGGVQQVCNHMPLCNGAGSTSFPTGDEEPGQKNARNHQISSEPPHPNMTDPNAVVLRVKSFENAMRRNFFGTQRDTPASVRRKAYVDFITSRGEVDWMKKLETTEPFNRAFEIFAVRDGEGVLSPAASYQQGLVMQANLSFLAAVPNLIDRIAYVESRYWTEDEKTTYLEGIDPEAELRKTMSPLVLEAVKKVPIQDWRLLARPAPNEVPLEVRTYDGFILGRAPQVHVAQDCIEQAEVTLAIAVVDPEQAHQGSRPYPVLVDWGDGSVTRHQLDPSGSVHSATHRYAEPGTYLAYVTVSNSTGLRGVSGIVVEAPQGSSEPVEGPSVATVQLDDVVAYSPATSRAGTLSFELAVSRGPGLEEAIGWSDAVTLAQAGPSPFGDLVGYNEPMTSFEGIVLRPFHTDGYFYDSVSFEAPSITLGIHDAEVGALATVTTPLTADMVRVYYRGATQPVPPEALERNLNGELRLPIDRVNDSLPDGFCADGPCRIVDRIEIDLRPDMLPAHPALPRLLPAGLMIGDSASWVEDVPNEFIPVQQTEAVSVPGSCSPRLEPFQVTARPPRRSFVTELLIEPSAPVVSNGAPTLLRAMATLEDGRTVDVTERVTWSSLDPSIVEVSNGVFTKGEVIGGIIPGEGRIVATLGDASAETSVTYRAPSRGYRSYRILFDEIHGPFGRLGISSAELLVEGRILENLMTSESEGRIGPFEATLESSAGADPSLAFDVSGSVWWSAPESFSAEAPHTVLEESVYLQVNFEQPVPVNGLRLLRMGGILFPSYGPQFPKTFQVWGSNDGVNFERVAGTSLEDWREAPVVLEWDVP